MPNGLEKKKWTKWGIPLIAVLALVVVIIWGMAARRSGVEIKPEANVVEEETPKTEEKESTGKVAGGETVSQKEKLSVKDQEWFRKGQPISFANKSWTPKGKEVELVDKDMRIVGKFQGFNIYVKENDKEPYKLVYIKTEAQSKYQPYEIYISAPGLG